MQSPLQISLPPALTPSELAICTQRRHRISVAPATLRKGAQRASCHPHLKGKIRHKCRPFCLKTSAYAPVSQAARCNNTNPQRAQTHTSHDRGLKIPPLTLDGVTVLAGIKFAGHPMRSVTPNHQSPHARRDVRQHARARRAAFDQYCLSLYTSTVNRCSSRREPPFVLVRATSKVAPWANSACRSNRVHAAWGPNLRRAIQIAKRNAACIRLCAVTG